RLRRAAGRACAARRRLRRSGFSLTQENVRLNPDLFGSTTGLDSGQTEAQEAEPDLRRVPAPVRRPRAPRVVVPAPTPDHPGRGQLRPPRIVGRRPLVIIGTVAVPAPLPDVPVHAIEAESIRLLLPDRVRLVARIRRIPGILA